jgi:hypothetical protein
MPYGKVYQITFTPQHTTDIVTIRIHDKETFDADPLLEEQIWSLNDTHDRVPAGNLIISTIDDEEDKFTPLKGSQAKFSFFSTNQFDFSTFLNGDDDRWLVKIWINALDAQNMIWTGLLMVEGMQEAYLAKPNVVELLATDNIGLLKEEKLVDFTGANPRGENKIIKYIAWALKKTGLSLEIWAFNNLMEESQPGLPFYESCFLQAKTFEDEIGTCEDCYAVLEKILGQSCFLFQWRARWVIVNVDELDFNDLYYFFFDELGDYQNRQQINPTADMYQLLGAYTGPATATPLKYINESAVQTAQLKCKETSLEYFYEYPQEIVDNIDFARGTNLLSIIPPPDMGIYIKTYATLGDFPSQGHTEYSYFASSTSKYYRWTGSFYIEITPAEAHIGTNYIIEDWTLQKNGGGAPQITAAVVKISLLGAPKATYVAMSTGQTQDHWIISNPIPLHLSDRFSFAVDRRLSGNIITTGQATEFFAQIRLVGDDGSFWTLENENGLAQPTGQWFPCSASFSTNQKYIKKTYDTSDHDDTEWMTAFVDARPLPASGKLYILLRCSSFSGTTTAQTHFTNVQFTYYPFVNGSYQTYRGHRHKVTQDGNLKAKRIQQVFINNSPKKLFKGSILIYNGTDHVLAGNFYKGNVFPLDNPGPDDLQAYGYHQAFSVWNQFNRMFRILDIEVEGLRTEGDIKFIPDLLHIYTPADNTPAAYNKYYMLLHKAQDFDNNMLSGRLIEIFDTSLQKVYDDDYLFQFISGGV